MTQTEALKLALEAFKKIRNDRYSHWEVDKEIDAIKEALAQPEQELVAQWLEDAFREGWAACRDAEFVGEDEENWKFGNSTANSRMIDLQQAQPKEPEQEPLETLAYKADYWRRMHDEVRAELIKSLNAKPEQKPVAWELGEEVYWGDSPELSDYVRKEGTPLYTTPPQRTWEGLSVFEINDLVENVEYEDYRGLVEATEAKLKEKNNA